MSILKKLDTFALTLLITGAIDSIRNLPSSALFGTTLIFFFIFAAIVFLIPSALVSAELSANVGEGGVYQWGRLAYGEDIGFLAVWLQWINNVIWFPTILSFLAGTAAYLIDPSLAQNKFYLVSIILSVFWLITIINLKGIRLSSKFTSFCAIAGLVIPIILIIGLMTAWLILGKPTQIHLTTSNIFPNWHESGNWFALTAIMLSFAGMELATVHIRDVREPQKTFPKALAYSTVMILITMILGSLAIAYILPNNQINLVNGTIQTFSYFLNAFHLNYFTPILTILLIVGSFGNIISWVISPIKGVSQAAQHGYLPAFFRRENKYGVSQNLLITQAVLVSFVCLTFLLLPSVNGSYWLLTDLSTQLYILMYIIMFVSAMRLRSKITYRENSFVIPGKKYGSWAVCILGLIACAITLLVGFIPPSNINVGGTVYYECLFSGGMLLMIAPILFCYCYERRKRKVLIKQVSMPISTNR